VPVASHGRASTLFQLFAQAENVVQLQQQRNQRLILTLEDMIATKLLYR
jgi:hypothetical protein